MEGQQNRGRIRRGVRGVGRHLYVRNPVGHSSVLGTTIKRERREEERKKRGREKWKRDIKERKEQNKKRKISKFASVEKDI